MRIRTDTAASAASLADYLRRCECLVEVIDGRIINATARPQSLAAPHQDGTDTAASAPPSLTTYDVASASSRSSTAGSSTPQQGHNLSRRLTKTSSAGGLSRRHRAMASSSAGALALPADLCFAAGARRRAAVGLHRRQPRRGRGAEQAATQRAPATTVTNAALRRWRLRCRASRRRPFASPPAGLPPERRREPAKTDDA